MPIRSAMDTSSAKDLTCIFSITLWRWALTVRSVQPSARAICLLVIAANDKLENFPLARRQSPDTGAHAVQFVLQIAQCSVVRESLFNRAKEVLGCYRLGQEVIRTRLDSPHRGRECRDCQ